MSSSNFEWNEAKNLENQEKHGVSFEEAQHAFLDQNRVIAEDLEHSQNEIRYYCFGKDKDGTGILTPVLTRNFGAAKQRKNCRRAADCYVSLSMIECVQTSHIYTQVIHENQHCYR